MDIHSSVSVFEICYDIISLGPRIKTVQIKEFQANSVLTINSRAVRLSML
jgi:hypothetical protein